MTIWLNEKKNIYKWMNYCLGDWKKWMKKWIKNEKRRYKYKSEWVNEKRMCKWMICLIDEWKPNELLN